MSCDLHQWGKDEIAREILAYLADHEDAGDTLEGIMQWWLLQRKIQNQLALVKKALNELVNDGYVREAIYADIEIRYYTKKHKNSGVL